MSWEFMSLLWVRRWRDVTSALDKEILETFAGRRKPGRPKGSRDRAPRAGRRFTSSSSSRPDAIPGSEFEFVMPVPIDGVGCRLPEAVAAAAAARATRPDTQPVLIQIGPGSPRPQSPLPSKPEAAGTGTGSLMQSSVAWHRQQTSAHSHRDPGWCNQDTVARLGLGVAGVAQAGTDSKCYDHPRHNHWHPGGRHAADLGPQFQHDSVREHWHHHHHELAQSGPYSESEDLKSLRGSQISSLARLPVSSSRHTRRLARAASPGRAYCLTGI